MFQEETGGLSFRHVEFGGIWAPNQSGSVGGTEISKEMGIGNTGLVVIGGDYS